MSFSGLNLAGSMLRSSRLMMDVSSRNLAGANEAGYVRQSGIVAESTVSSGRNQAVGLTGLGSQLEGIGRTKARLLDANYRLASQDVGSASAVTPWIEQIEATLSRTDGLQTQASGLAQAAGELASSPGESAVRGQFLEQARSFTDEVRTQSAQLDQIGNQAKQDLTGKLDRANEILGRLADLNPRITSSATNTMGANQLLDERDQLLDELHGLMDVQINEQKGGAVTVHANGAELVFGNRSEKLALDGTGGLVTGSGTAVKVSSGSIQSLQNFVNTEIPGYKAQLNALATTTATQLNAVHRNGYGLDGSTGRDLFTATSAGDFRVAITDQRQLATATARLESAAPVGTANFNAANTLASQSAELTTPLASSGSLSVNGTTINYTDSQTLQDVLSSFSAAGVNARYDSSSKRVVLAADPSTQNTVTVTDTTGNFAAAFGITGASSPGGPSDGEAFRQLANKLSQPLFGNPANRPLGQATTDLVVSAGQRSQAASRAQTAASSAQQAALEQRQSVQGVSTDEELLNLTKYQQAYAAAAKVASIADEVLSTFLREIG